MPKVLCGYDFAGKILFFFLSVKKLLNNKTVGHVAFMQIFAKLNKD